MPVRRSISGFGIVTPDIIVHAGKKFGTPCYLYDRTILENQCDAALAMPNAYGLTVRYAPKANSTMAILQITDRKGLSYDLSSLDEAKRLIKAGIPIKKGMLTSQEVHSGKELEQLFDMMGKGMKYNTCSQRQLCTIGSFAAKNKLPISMRVNPGVGSGESSTRNTGDKYAPFGIHLTDLPGTLRCADKYGLIVDEVHVHIGSGGDPKKWKENIDRELGIIEKYFIKGPNKFPINTVNFGGGFKVARMPGDNAADIEELGNYAKMRIEGFYKKHGIKLKMEIEPGTFIVANAGYLITQIMDIKQTGKDGFQFIVTDGGMEVNTRPLLYGSQHPFYLVSKTGTLFSSEFDLQKAVATVKPHVIAGRCCESGDAQTLDEHHHIITREIGDPCFEDYLVIGGTGAYCSSMSPFNYNSHLQIPEVLYDESGCLQLIRQKQTLEQLVQNEKPLK